MRGAEYAAKSEKLTARWLWIAAGLSLAGCGMSPPTEKAGPCNPSAHACKVLISVVDCVPTPDIDPVPIDKTIRPAEIHWQIDAASAQEGYRFEPRTGIVPTDDAEQQFFGPSNPSPTQFQWHDKNTNTTRYKYTINIRKGTTACPAKDPFIANGR